MIDYRARLTELRKRKDTLETDLQTVSATLQEKIQERDTLDKVKKIYSKAAVIGRESMRQTLERLVTDGLRVVHQHALQFIIKDALGHGKAGSVFKLQKDGKVSGLLCFGGGIRNIISTILRFIFAEYHTPRLALPLILDEVGNNLSKEYQAKFGELLSTLSRKFNRQVILITHQQAVIKYADKIIALAYQENKTILG